MSGDEKGKIVLIGGSGIKDDPQFENVPWRRIDTGIPHRSDLGEIVHDGRVWYQQSDGVVFIPRHGHDVHLNPDLTPYRANIVAAYLLGAKLIISTSAVGSLSSEIPIESVVIPDDYIDETQRNADLFSSGGITVHANPRPAFDRSLRGILIKTAEDLQTEEEKKFKHLKKEGRYVTIPGPSFGTAAEGRKRAMYADIVGMTACPEATFAMQAGIPYAIIAFVVDMDSDAKHEQTLEYMGKFSEKTPAYFARVIQKAKDLNLGETPLGGQLRGNLIPGNLELITNPHLRRIAEELIVKYG